MDNSIESERLSRQRAPEAGRVETVMPVSLLVGSARLLIERHLGLAWISGEISGFSRAVSGHCYFVLKDERAQVRCVLFRSKAQLLDLPLRDGLAVEVRASPTIYEARGEFQLDVDAVRLAGPGALYERFARLKARLEAAGWFRSERKRSLPAFPRGIGLVTSLRAAALSDVLTTLKRRMPLLPVVIYPAAVHGSGATAEIVAAIAAANARREVEVLIVCRGGGSIEDLQPFNEESVARAVLESEIPVVAGIGHETDFTICDFVADARAATPTGAAALVSPERAALLERIEGCTTRWQRSIERSLQGHMQRIDLASHRLVHPAARLTAQSAAVTALARRLMVACAAVRTRREHELAAHARVVTRLLREQMPQVARVARLGERLTRNAGNTVGALSQRLAALSEGLKHLNPQAVLDRGYSIVTTATGAIVQDARQLAAGDSVSLRFARGAADAEITARKGDR